MTSLRYENADHGIKAGATVSMFDGGRNHFGVVTGFESFEGSGLVLVDSMLVVKWSDRSTSVVGHGAVKVVAR